MKNIIVIFATIILSVNAFAQNGKSIYQKYSDEKGIEAVYVSPAMFKLIGNLPMDLGEDMNLASIVKSLSGFYLLSSSDPEVGGKIKNDVSKFMKNGKYELLMEAKDEGDKMTIYTVNEGDYVTSLVMIADELGGGETTFICLDGRILYSDLENMIANAVN